MPTGEVELQVDELEIVSRSTPLPFQLDEEGVDETLRLRYRWLDLRRDKLQRNLAAARADGRDRSGARWRLRASSTSRRRSSSSRHPRAHATSSSRAAPAGPLLRAAAVSPQIFKQLLHDRRVRPLLPDRDLLPGRGSPRRPACRSSRQLDVEMAFPTARSCSTLHGAGRRRRDLARGLGIEIPTRRSRA